MRLKKKALIPPLLATVAFLLSPDFYNKLPDKYAHIISGLAIIISAFSPALLKHDKIGEENGETPGSKNSSE